MCRSPPTAATSWTDVSAALPDRWVTSVRAEPARPRDGCYVTISGFRWGSPLPHVFRTTDLGATWAADRRQPARGAGQRPRRSTRSTRSGSSSATDVGVLRDARRGRRPGRPLGSNLPNVVVTTLALDPENQLLVVGTFGRSLFSIPVELDLFFYDGFESGDASRWSVVVGGT